MTDYTIDDIFDSNSSFYKGGLVLDIPPAARNSFSSAINPASLAAGELQGNTTVTDGYLQSDDYEEDVSGWRLSPDDAQINVPTALHSLDIPDTTTSNSFHVDSDGNVWWGSTSLLTALASILNTGAGTFTDVAITGGSIGGTTTVGVSNLNIANRGWVQTCAFTADGAVQVGWGAGIFTAADGTAYSIIAGNTGTMSAKTYIYLDISITTSAYQVTTTPISAVGAGKVLIAIAEDGTDEASYAVLGGQGGQRIDASTQIVANSITANQLAAALVYAGVLEIDTAGNIHSGQSTYDSGLGWFIGNSGGVAKFSIGNSAGDKMTWDGSNLRVKGSIEFSSVLNLISYTVANLPIPPTTAGFNQPSAYE